MGGLKGNWEAFTVLRLTGGDATDMSGRIAGWVSSWESNLVPIHDQRVLERAAKNTGSERTLKTVPKPATPEPKAIEAGVEILIAEIPRSHVRRSQANFDVQNYEQFFGAKVGTKKQVLLYHVRDNGELEDVESRPSVQVRSHNYRFELAAARGFSYPTDGRPIAVFMRLSTGEFLYVLLLPNSKDYTTVSKILEDQTTVQPGRMRRYRTTVDHLKALWPSAVLWQAKLPQL